MLQRLTDHRTLHVLVATPGGAAGQGGIDRAMAALRQSLVAAGDDSLEVSFAATRGTGSVLLSPLHLGLFLLRMLVLKASRRLDLIHINLASYGSTYRKLQVARLARLLGVPYVLHLHGGDYPRFWTDRPRRRNRAIRAMFEGAASIIVLGNVWRDFVASRAPAAADRIAVLPNASAAAPAHVASAAGDVHILFLGRIAGYKGVVELGEALHSLRDMPGWRATLAGDGEIEAARRRAAELGLAERVAIPGWVGPDQVASLLAGADVLVQPSHTENLPLSVIEAMAAGLAVVATPVGAVPDIVRDGETGLLVPPGDAGALAAALRRLIAEPDLRARLGLAARQFHRDNLDLGTYAAAMHRLWAKSSR